MFLVFLGAAAQCIFYFIIYEYLIWCLMSYDVLFGPVYANAMGLAGYDHNTRAEVSVREQSEASIV